MNMVLLEIPKEDQKIRIPDSYVNNFLNINFFYFQIPTNLPISDQDHLRTIAKQFFKLQLNIPIESSVFIKEISFLKNIQSIAKEISWEIFYRFNHSVKIKSNVFDDTLQWDISGFNGKIINFYSGKNQDVYQIQYSAESLVKIPLPVLKRISRNNSPFYTYLEPEFIMPDLTKTNIAQDQTNLIKLFENIIDHFALPPEIYAFISESNSFLEIVQKWEAFLRNLLLESQTIEVVLYNQHKYQLLDICESDEFVGVWGKFLKENIQYIFPLTEIKKVTTHGIYDEMIQIYKQIMELILPN